ncbi:MAG: YegS/Rv2252/BmrU family lipid kinase [Prevotellaceae bacterium]|nr:YegS/Rv2252/BmrU family lipid kinase [Prevotella sp.]MDD7258273.1 YegS/Rv2252/BmrU family lipid kinase [Prevotellaceae bacterium]MDY6130978.1 YegS/Rv2252/BmrU family lipid kinase [Prevotella sp.]
MNQNYFVLLQTMKEMMRILFVMNPISGTVEKSNIPQLIEETLDKSLFDYSVAETEYAGHATQLAQKAKADGVDIVVAVGGDGTVNEVARAIIDSKTALGIIPCGSGNGLARHLLLPMDIKKSIGVINKCVINELDYGLVNGMPFFCTCGMGFDAFISMKFAEAGKRGMLTYVENVLREGLSYKPETYKIENEEGMTIHKAFLISCANASQYGNNAYIAPQASMSDGLLDVIIMEPFSVIEAPQVAIEMMNKTLDKNQKIKTLKTDHIRIHRERPGFIHYDGDPVMAEADVDIRLVQKGIRMIVNPDADRSKRQPNLVQTAFSEFFNDINIVREDLTKQGRTIQAINKKLLRKFNHL